MWKCKTCGLEFNTPVPKIGSGLPCCISCNSEDLDDNFKQTTQLKSLRYNLEKPKWSQLHYESLVPMIRVLEAGERKYSRKNWQVGLDLVEIQESAQRHLAAIMDGELYDKETGELHMAHVMCNGLFWIYHFNKNKQNEEQ